MADADTVAPEPRHLAIAEMDPVGEPDAVVQPAAFLEKSTAGSRNGETDNRPPRASRPDGCAADN